MGKFSRDKGNRVEREIVRKLQDVFGLAAERVPLSGASGGRFGADISIPLLGRDLRAEVKARASGFTRIYDWLAGNDLLIIKADHKQMLVVLPLDSAADYARLLEASKQEKVSGT